MKVVFKERTTEAAYLLFTEHSNLCVPPKLRLNTETVQKGSRTEHFLHDEVEKKMSKQGKEKHVICSSSQDKEANIANE